MQLNTQESIIMTDNYSGPDRRNAGTQLILTEEQMEAIAERAAVKAMELATNAVYQQVGKNVVQKIFYVVGALAIGLWLWMKKEGWVH